MKNDRFLRALRREPVDATPVWLMRQAGRYLPEYRATRAKAGSFMGLATNPELACEVTLQPLRRFPLDAAILFSDILTVPDAMGLGLSFAEGEGPRFARPVRSAADVAKLAVPDMEGELRYVMDALRLIRRELNGSVPLIGFSGSPWTLACYMVEGGGSDNFSKIKAMAFSEPALMDHLLSHEADEFPDWSSLVLGIQMAPWADELAQVVLQEPGGEWFLTVAAGLHYMAGKPLVGHAARDDDESEDDETEDEGDSHDGVEDSDGAGDGDARSRKEAGDDWMVEQGFDRKDE